MNLDEMCLKNYLIYSMALNLTTFMFILTVYKLYDKRMFVKIAKYWSIKNALYRSMVILWRKTSKSRMTYMYNVDL